MKSRCSIAHTAKGFTFIELTIIITMLLTLTAVTMFASHRYLYEAHRASCLMNQDTIRKVLIANANLKNQEFHAGVDYCDTEDARQLFPQDPTCPDGGGYVAKLAPNGEQLVISCKHHGDHHK